jgi:hypothetical protein
VVADERLAPLRDDGCMEVDGFREIRMHRADPTLFYFRA